MSLLIQNGIVVDPATKKEEKADVLIQKDKIVKIASAITEEAEEVLDAKGCYVMPGFVDLHVHLREPGFEYKETIETGSRAAAHGGFTTICAMPNTKPVIDNKDRVKYVYNTAEDVSDIHVLQIGAVTKGQAGEEVSDIAGMAQMGIVAISEDGKSVMNTKVYVDAMKEAKAHNIPVFAHCEDQNLADGGVINAGKKAEELGVQGISNAVEEIIMGRDIILARDIDVQMHFCHCSTAFTVQLMRYVKERKDRMTAEVCPHHFTLTDEDIPGEDSNYKMNPPLRSKADVQALKEGLRDGIIDVIATDHAPHHFDDKNCKIEKAAFGIVGLETAAALTYTELVDQGWLTIMQMAEKMSYNPAQIIHSDKGTVQEGRIADLVIFDPNQEYEIDASQFASMGRNTPFNGRKVKGMVMATICDGKVVYRQEKKND